MEAAANIPGYRRYTITPDGKVFCGNRLLKPMPNPGRSVRVRLKDSSGKTIRIAIAKLIALTFIPNPHNYSRIIFKDRDKNNCRSDNIQWVSGGEFVRFVNGYAQSDNLLGPPKPKREPDWIDPERVPLNGFPGYYITANAVVYRGSRIIKPVAKKNKSLKIRIRKGGGDRIFGLAKLVAEHFIAKPHSHYHHIIFKDRNNHNCRVHNIAWVDGETFIYYCGIHSGPKKIILPREEAIRGCTNIYLRRYYQTLDESWLHECWNELEKKITLENWNSYRSECYMYFFDRARRFSVLRNPLGLVLHYVKGVRAKLWKEISPAMPMRAVVRTDESLRNLKRVTNREW